jgi:formylglycine-generating enzyme required for sulfatase activity
MNFLKKLFIKSKTDLKETEPSLPNQKNIEIPGANWYFTRSKDGKIAQIVLSASVSCIIETEFGMITLPYNLFPMLASQPWCSGFVPMSDKPIPYLMVRVDEFDEEVKKSDLTIAFSFCKLSSGGIFLIDVRIENQSLGISVRKKFPYLPPISKPVVEWVVSMEDSYCLQMMKDVFSSSYMNIIVANSQGAHTTICDNMGIRKNCLGPCAHHDRIVTLDQKVNNLLTNELKLLLDYHNSIPSSCRSFQRVNQELGNLLPLDKDPIMEPSTCNRTGLPPETIFSPDFSSKLTSGSASFTESVNGVNIEMVPIKGGTFLMGNFASEDDSQTIHQVMVSDFYIGKYEVTQAQWKAVMGNNPSNFKGDNLPVETVSWNDVQEFLQSFNAKTGLTYRLPTEAEWEYACRAGTTTPFNTGNNLKTSQANYDGNYPYKDNIKGEFRKKTMPVGSFPPNGWGLYDMHGNVWEWCNDWYVEHYYHSTDSPLFNPTGPSTPPPWSPRVFRGGGGDSSAKSCRATYRGSSSQGNSNRYIGFRLCYPR